jgi:hypothetical protein
MQHPEKEEATSFRENIVLHFPRKMTLKSCFTTTKSKKNAGTKPAFWDSFSWGNEVLFIRG